MSVELKNLAGGGGGTGDVTAAANIADNAVVRGDGGAKGIQSSNASLSDAGTMNLAAGQTYDINGTPLAYTDITNSIGAGAVIVDHTIVRGDGGARGTQDTGWTIDDSDVVTAAGQLALGENDIKLDGALSADGTYSGITVPGTLGDTIGFGTLCYLATGDQRWEKADADAEATSGNVMLGICLDGGNDGDATTMLVYGLVREDDWNFTSYGHSLYVDTTAGNMNTVAPTATGDIIRVVGHVWYTADEIFFNPDGCWVEKV